MIKKVKGSMGIESEVRFQNGVWVWISNGRVPPADAIKDYGIDKLPNFDKARHDQVRDQQTAEFLDSYRKKMESWEPSAEEMYEMRAAYGKGATVINLITGRKYKV
jgi:hypothetical protein